MNLHTRVAVVELENRVPSFRSFGLDPDSGDMRILSRMNSLAEEGTLIVKKSSPPKYILKDERLSIIGEHHKDRCQEVWVLLTGGD